ncbi:MAG: fibronectin type III domain-containing protein [Ferruginibacter sp.]
MYLKNVSIILIATSLVNKCAYAQSNGIGTVTPHASAKLEIAATSKGLLPPRIALRNISDVTTIISPAAGLLVYNIATAGTVPDNVLPGYYFFNGIRWLRIGITGNSIGDMQYWDGKQWVLLPAGINNQELSICNGTPVWGPCPGSSSLPSVRTGAITGIRGTIASAAGNVIASGGTTVNARGICYSRNLNPVAGDSTINRDKGTGNFIASISGLLPETVYHVRAFATNSAGTSYGSDSVFKTTKVIKPDIETMQPFGIGSTTAYSGGIIKDDGGAPLNSRMLYYSTIANMNGFEPFIFDPFQTTGSYYSYITGLQPNTTYYVRASAANNYTNVAYGSIYSFTTRPAGEFTAVYFFDSVKAGNGGTIAPGPQPVISGLNCSAVKVVGTGDASPNSTVDAAFSFTNWSLGAVNASDNFPTHTDTTTKYFEFTISPNTGKTFSLTYIKFKWQRNATGVRRAFVKSSADGFTAKLPASINPANSALSVPAIGTFQINDAATTGQEGCTITLNGAAFTNITTSITFRIYGMFAEDSNGSFCIDNLVVNGIVN